MVRLSVRDILLILLGQKISTVGKEQGGGPHKDEVGAETTTVSATRGLWELLMTPGWTGASEWLSWAEGMAETCTLTSPANPETEHPPLGLVAPELETWTKEGGSSTTGVPQNPKMRLTISGWRLHSVGIGWFGRDRWSAITFRQPGICHARTIMFWASNQRRSSTVKNSKVGERVPSCLLIYETTVEFSPEWKRP